MIQNPTPEHQRLVSALASHFINTLGLTILSASINGFQAPSKFGRHEPDIVAQDSTGLIHIAEAKTGNDISGQISKEQYIDFANRVMINDGRLVTFHVIVYKEDETDLVNQLSQLGLGYKIGGQIKIWTL